MRTKLMSYAVAALALAAAGAAVPAAAIEEHPECRSQVTAGSRTASGPVYGVLPLTAGTDTSKYPVSAVATCSVVVDGVTYWSASAAGTGVAVVAGNASFPFSATGFQVCTTLDYTSSDAETNHWCTTHRWRTDPWDTLNDVNRLVTPVYERVNDAAEQYVDPQLCPLLARLAPGVPDVTITPEGDVYVFGQFFWDCPPYEA